MPDGVRCGTMGVGFDPVEADEDALPRLVELACLEWRRSLCSPKLVVAALGLSMGGPGVASGALPGAAGVWIVGNMGNDGE